MDFGGRMIFTSQLTNCERVKLSRQHQRGEVTKLACGIYYPTSDFRQLPPYNKSLLVTIALGMRGRVLVGNSATALWLCPELGSGHFAPEVVGRNDRSTPAVIMRQVPTPYVRTTSIGNAQLTLTSPALTVLDMARWHGVAHG